MLMNSVQSEAAFFGEVQKLGKLFVFSYFGINFTFTVFIAP